MLRSRFEISRNWTILLCSSVTEKSKSIFMPRIYVAPRSRRNSYQRMDPKQCTIWPCTRTKKFAITTEDTVLKFRFNLCFKIKPYLGFEIVNGIDKFVREAMPIQEEETASGKPAAKARPISKSSSTSGWDFTPIEQRQWIDIETQESNDPCCFQVSKFITRLLRHSQKVHREEDGAVHYDQGIEECKIKQFGNTEYWSVEMKKDFVHAPHWSIENWISVLAKGGGQKKRFQCCLNPNYPHQFLYLRAIQGLSGSAINPALQDNVLLPTGFTE